MFGCISDRGWSARGALAAAAAKAAAAQFVPALIVERTDGSEAAPPAACGGVSSIRARGITEGPPQVSEGGSLWHTVPGRRAGGCPARHRKIVCGLGAALGQYEYTELRHRGYD